MFPERFLPPPVVLQEEGNTVKLATPGNLPDGFCYTKPSHAERLNIELSELPYDTYCPSSEGTLGPHLSHANSPPESEHSGSGVILKARFELPN